VRVTIVQIKVVHTVIFALLSACVVLVLYSGVANWITAWTWGALLLLSVESIVLVASGWRCPLTALAERLGATEGAVADIFLPRWLADRIFPVCGSLFAIACAILAARLWTR
jgi:hypothetical protein